MTNYKPQGASLKLIWYNIAYFSSGYFGRIIVFISGRRFKRLVACSVLYFRKQSNNVIGLGCHPTNTEPLKLPHSPPNHPSLRNLCANVIVFFLVQAMVNGEVVGQFDSNPATPYTSFDIQGTGVENITFTTVGLTSNDWISIFEVSDSPCRLSHGRPPCC